MKDQLSKKREQFRVEIRSNLNQTIIRQRRKEMVEDRANEIIKNAEIQSIIKAIPYCSEFNYPVVDELLCRINRFNGDSLDHQPIVQFVVKVIKYLKAQKVDRAFQKMLQTCRKILNGLLAGPDEMVMKHLQNQNVKEVCAYADMVPLYYNISLIARWHSHHLKQQYLNMFLCIANHKEFYDQNHIYVLSNFVQGSEQLSFELEYALISRISRLLELTYYIQLQEEAITELVIILANIASNRECQKMIIQSEFIMSKIIDLYIKQPNNRFNLYLMQLFDRLFVYPSIVCQLLETEPMIINILKKELQTFNSNYQAKVLTCIKHLAQFKEITRRFLEEELVSRILYFSQCGINQTIRILATEAILFLLNNSSNQDVVIILTLNTACIFKSCIKSDNLNIVSKGLQAAARLLDLHQLYSSKEFDIRHELLQRYSVGKVVENCGLEIHPNSNISNLAMQILHYEQ